MNLAIYCCGGHGRELLILANKINAIHHRWDEIVFADDNINGSFPVHNTVLSFGKIKAKYDISNCEFIIASGEPYLLKVLSNKVLDSGYNLTQLIADDAINSDIQTQQGCIVQERVVITCNISLGTSTYIGFSSVVHHDVRIGNYCFIAANSTICGNALIGDSTYIGAGSVIRDELKIGSNCIIGMGSVVVNDVPDNSVIYGNPAIIVSHNTKKSIFR